MSKISRALQHEPTLLLIGLLIKLALGTVFASTYLTDLFIPFVQGFVSAPLESPYSKAVLEGRAEAFPYPSVMLAVLSVPQLLLTQINVTHPIVTLLTYRVALLAADITIYLSLRKLLFQDHVVRFAWLYWLSPVAIYITYIHGQLDVIPIAFLTASMVMLFSRRVGVSALLFGCALGAKTSIALVLPVFFLYLFERPNTARQSLRFFCIAVVTFVVLNMPFIGQSAFLNMVFRNDQQAKLLALSIPMGEAVFYVVPVALIVLWGLGARVGMTNRGLFVMFMGFFFCVVLVLIPPMHGWYYWILPFFAFFYARNPKETVVPFVLVQAFYLVYFLFSPISDYMQVFQYFAVATPELGWAYNHLAELGWNAQAIHNLAFTLMQSSLIFLCIRTYRYGVRRYRVQKITGQPFLLGIGGNSGVGKSTLTGALTEIFGADETTILRGDDRHKWQRGHPEWQRFTHLNPKANYLYPEIDTLRLLKKGKKIWRSIYDHGTGTFTQKMPVLPRRLMIHEGLHPFFLKDQRELFDLRVFIEPEAQLGLHWKICRDRQKRNYDTEQVLAQLEHRREDAERFIASQRSLADIVLTPKADREITPLGEPGVAFDLEYELTLRNVLDIAAVVEWLEALEGLDVHHHYEDVQHQKITIGGTCSEADRAKMLDYFHEPMQEIGINPEHWPEGLFGAIMFVFVYIVFMRADHDL